MAARPLFRRHEAASRTRYQELKQLARGQARVLAGTPGTLKRRTQGGKEYWVREYIRPDGRKVDEYLGAASAIPASQVEGLQQEMELARALAAGSSQLRLFGYQRLERKPAAVLAMVFNRGLAGAGLVLVGSHAYGALLNELGLQSPAYRTEDVDLARSRPLKMALPSGADFATLLDDTGLRFVPVPGMPSHAPSASFKLPGAERLCVDLLVPGPRIGQVVAADDLGGHAQSVPLLDFLVADPLDAVVLSPNQVIPVKIPAPERMLLHKLYASQSRRSDRDKARKDLEQAAVLAAALEEETPGAISDAYRRVPSAGRTAVKRGALAASRLMSASHPDAAAVLLRLSR